MHTTSPQTKPAEGTQSASELYSAMRRAGMIADSIASDAACGKCALDADFAANWRAMHDKAVKVAEDARAAFYAAGGFAAMR